MGKELGRSIGLLYWIIDGTRATPGKGSIARLQEGVNGVVESGMRQHQCMSSTKLFTPQQGEYFHVDAFIFLLRFCAL